MGRMDACDTDESVAMQSSACLDKFQVMPMSDLKPGLMGGTNFL